MVMGVFRKEYLLHLEQEFAASEALYWRVVSRGENFFEEPRHRATMRRAKLRWVLLWLRNRALGGMAALASIAAPIGAVGFIFGEERLPDHPYLFGAVALAIYGGFIWLLTTHQRLEEFAAELQAEERVADAILEQYRHAAGYSTRYRPEVRQHD